MGILFKTYNGRHQLHVCRETWLVNDKKQLDEVLGLFSEPEMKKIVIKPIKEKISLEFADVIINCHGIPDLKKKFSLLVDLKTEYQDLGKKH